MRPKVLIVSYYFSPMNGPVTQHPTWFFRFLPEYGFEPHVISSSVFYGENQGAPLIEGDVHSVPRGKLGQQYAYQLSRAEFYVQGKLRMWDHGFAWGRVFGIREARRLVAAGGVKAIVSVSPSIASHWTAYKIKRCFPSLIWIADFTDPFLGNPFRVSPTWLAPYERRMERRFFASADHLAANTKPARDLWRARYPKFADKFVVLPNGFDPEEPISPLPLPERPTPILAHVGGVYGGRVPNALFEGLFELNRAGRIDPGQITIEFLGASDFSGVRALDHFQTLCRSGLVKVRNEYLPRQQALRYTAEADFLLLLDITEPYNTKLQVPSKVFDYIRIGRPILAFTARASPTERLLEQSGIRHVMIANEASTEAVQDGILRFLALQRDPQPPSEWITRYFDARKVAGDVSRLVQGDRVEDIPLW